MANPGLDIQALRALRKLPHDLPLLQRRILAHYDQHEGYLAFSSGKDSLVALHLTRELVDDVPVVFFDSGFEFPETHEYLAQLAEAWDLNFHVIPAERTSLELMAESGTWDHHHPAPPREVDLFTHLIATPSAKAHTMFGAGEIWGLRAAESRGRAAALTNGLREAVCDCEPVCDPARRRVHHGGIIERQDGSVAFSPVWNWKADQVWTYIAQHGLPINPVYDKLRQLGVPEASLRLSQILDGNQLEAGRLTWLKMGWPTLFDELALVLPRVREYL